MKTNDIVIATVGSWESNPESVVGKVIRVPKTAHNYLLNQNAVRLRCKNKEQQIFTYYQLKNKDFFRHIIKRAQGSANQASITLQDIFDFKFLIPYDQKELIRVSTFLDNLDQRIENLRKQNKTLEKIAQTLFKHWFIDFEFPDENGNPYKSSGGAMKPSELGEIPEDWEVGNLGEIAIFKNGESPPEKSENYAIPIYGSNGIIGQTNLFNYQDAVVVGRVGSYCGSIYYCLNQCWITDNAMVGKLKHKENNAFLYLLLKNKQLNKLRTGSGQPLLNQNILCSIELAIPNSYLIKKFELIILSLFVKIDRNSKQVQTLTKTRDTLLPKLMSGKLRVKEENIIEEVNEAS